MTDIERLAEGLSQLTTIAGQMQAHSKVQDDLLKQIISNQQKIIQMLMVIFMGGDDRK